MEFECSEMTYLGCERMDFVKGLMLTNRDEILCKNMCCVGCEESCGYRCSRAGLSKEKRMIPIRDSEEVQMEKLLGIRCFRCGKVINQEGHKLESFPLEPFEYSCKWYCEECFKWLCGPGVYKEHKEDPSDEFRESDIEKIEYEQLSFL